MTRLATYMSRLAFFSPNIDLGFPNPSTIGICVTSSLSPIQSPPRINAAMDVSDEHSNGGGGHHGYEWKLPAALSANTTSVHVTALDGVVNVNSLFTVAVFVGLSLATPDELRSLAGDQSCDAGPGVARSLLVLEVVAFSSFLFSSLVAQGLKLALNLINSKDPHDTLHAHIDARLLRLGMLASAVGSVVGCVFLLVSMVMVVQIRLGTLGCATNRAAAKAAAGLIGLVTTALAVYVGTVFYTFTH
ncbi:hypothetical protein E2562_018775 [Oryza meyeriana var. granulata]|uniref:Uncharacterized protein n=1 Tax=Oryza meyeriana var. granulata TaxID=110450 RepID=A0A6G1EX96_9ORYZ|nr:hypothetical protein E2562_018775 [Oryza meyeriana var. granulata]